MDTTITPAPAGKRARNGSMILTDRLCQKRVAKRIKFYDRKCPGLYVSITTAGVATFSFKFTDRATGKQRTGWLGLYNPETFTVEDARSKVYGLKGMGGDAMAETFRDRKERQAKRGKTVDEIIEERIAWMQTPVRKADGDMRPRLESWENTASHLRRFIGSKLGRKIAADVTRGDIQALSDDIVAGRHGGKPSVSNARHMRKAASGMFRWALRREYITANPCSDLEPLDPEHPRTRVLSEDEIRIFWHGLDREDLMTPWDRRTRLALKLELATMLRSAELLGAHRNEVIDLDGEQPRLDVPLKRVKKRRVIQQPLSSLAVEIINEALKGNNKDFVFASPLDNKPMHRKAMADALRGDKRKGKVRTPGICQLLGLKPFTPHYLRRTAASWARRIGQPMAKIALCLDHRVTMEDGIKLPPVTGKHYVHAEESEVKEKREVLQAWAAELRRIIAEPAPAMSAKADLRLVA
ncbi:MULTISPECIES: integrase family protein [unclassified Bradyrhizobium]|uniref:tyrosine-type recombinase/integrase n=1 Tax=unclassified Bradyrhizobium TaxID=2631580 RepID=UPI001FFA4F65|nr:MULTISPECIES: integrase family protein [unclassified Bradyrhizobium]MCK1669742.1 integrase family protein [Bradyrhizobium sp. 153]MCK1758799.1 integrase family protein [Bradyrhizobium sp. 137]